MNTIGVVCCMCAILVCFGTRQGHAEEIAADNSQNSLDKLQMLKNYCDTLCSSSSVCPRICEQAFQQPVAEKRNALDGLTFDDYLFMRLLGRDLQGKRR